MTQEEKIKYYRLCCNHVSIDRPIQSYPIPDDYPFMSYVEHKLELPHHLIGDFRYYVCTKGISYLDMFDWRDEVDWTREGF